MVPFGKDYAVVETKTGSQSNQKFNFSWTIPLDQAGQVLNLTMRVNDTVGNSNNSIAQTVTIKDGTAPNITVTSPGNHSNLSNTRPAFIFTVTDNEDSELWCNITVDGLLNFSNVNVTSGVQQTNYTSNFTSQGSHNWSINCTDNSGNIII